MLCTFQIEVKQSFKSLWPLKCCGLALWLGCIVPKITTSNTKSGSSIKCVDTFCIAFNGRTKVTH